jgi:hypothetical protein
MHPRSRFWLVLLGAFLGLVAIACSCSALPGLPSLLSQPTNPSVPAVPTLAPQATAAVPANNSSEPIPGLAGKWQDPDTTTVHTIAWQGGKYVVVSANNPDNGSYQVTSQDWSGGVLTWTYYVPSSGYSVSFETVSVSGDSLYTNWSNDQGASGIETLQRVP